jgi:vacuolar protein sorting-associated protein 13A/C
MKTSYTEITMKLEDIIVTDLNPKTIHTNILSIVGGDALAVRVVIYNLEQTSNYNSDNMMIEMTMGCAKIIFMNWFVTSVLNFLDHFQTAQERIKEASKAAAEAAKQSAVQAYEQASRIRMGIKIKAPIILVPVHSQSREAIVIDLGNLKISNFIKSIEVENEHGPALIDEMKVELSDVKLSKVSLVDDNNESAPNNISSRFQSLGNEELLM